MFTEKNIVAINLENHWVDDFSFKFLYLDSFCFCYYNESPVKQWTGFYMIMASAMKDLNIILV